MISRIDRVSRRAVLAAATGAALTSLTEAKEEIRVIDIHQHTNYNGRTDEQLVAHQT